MVQRAVSPRPEEGGDALVEDRTLLGLVDDWRAFLGERIEEIEARRLERRLSTGRPLGSLEFLRDLEERLGREIVVGKPGWPKGRSRKTRCGAIRFMSPMALK